jgi:cell wall-associated NlpC family hydrolase
MLIKFIPCTKAFTISLVLLELVSSSLAYGAGLPSSELQALYLYPNYVSTYAGCTGGSSSTSTTVTSTASSTDEQNQNAQTIIGIAKTLNLGQTGADIGIMTALDESELQNHSNTNVAISLSNPAAQGTGDNGNSVGIFQQQPNDGWSTFATGAAALTSQSAVWQDMTPAFSAEAFFGDAPGATLQEGLVNPGALEKGLQDHTGWQSEEPWVAASEVQGNEAGASVYQPFYTKAEALVNQFWATTAAIPLPISETGGTASTGSTSEGTDGCYTAGTAGDTSSNAKTQAVIQAGLAEIAKGIPYAYGGGGPNGPSLGSDGLIGFDCSAFMQYVFEQGAQIAIPRTAQAQYNATVGVGNTATQSTIQPGDLMFFGSSPTDVEHVDMYVGSNMVIEAPETGENLHEIPLYIVAAPGETLQGIGFFPPIGGQ